jgi:hypothetical protein
MKTIKNASLFLLFNFLIIGFTYSQAANKFSKKITSYLSKDEVEKAEEFCNQQKSEQDRAECYTLMGNSALDELEYSRAMKYFKKAKNNDKLYATLLKAIESGNQELINNYLIRVVKENTQSNNESEITNKAFLPIAKICYKKKDFKNAGYYYERAGIKQLSIECKVVHAINTKDYITVVELSEKETIGLRNTLQVYKQAADQYFAKGDYQNAAKCYDKTGNKTKAKLCNNKERELVLKKSFAAVLANKFEFSESPLTIKKKLDVLSAEVNTFEQIAKQYEQNEYKIEADSWRSFSKLFIRVVKESNNGCILIKSTSKDLGDGKMLLAEAWKQINEIANKKKVNLSIQDQESLKTIVKKIELLNEDYSQKAQSMANKQLEKLGITKLKTIHQFPAAIEAAKKLIDDYFININTKETPQHTSWLLFGIVNKMVAGINSKLDELDSSAQSAAIKDKVAEQKSAFEGYFLNKLKGAVYTAKSYTPSTWANYLFQKALKEKLN